MCLFPRAKTQLVSSVYSTCRMRSQSMERSSPRSRLEVANKSNQNKNPRKQLDMFSYCFSNFYFNQAASKSIAPEQLFQSNKYQQHCFRFVLKKWKFEFTLLFFALIYIFLETFYFINLFFCSLGDFKPEIQNACLKT